MQDLLSSPALPIGIGVIVVVLVILIAVPLILRRRNTFADEEPPEFGQAVDYTSMEVQEPTGWRERFGNLSLAGKILVFVVPLLLLVAVTVLILLLSGERTAQGPEPTPVLPPEITITTARLTGISPQRLRIEADSTLPPGTEVTAQMIVDEALLPWFAPEVTTSVAADGSIEGIWTKAEEGPSPEQGTEPAVQLQATVNGQEVVSNAQPVEIPELEDYANAFFGGSVAQAEPTPTEAVEEATPTATPEEDPEEETPEPEPTTLPTATTSSIGDAELVATVSNGGNVRQEPLLIDNVVAQINAGEQVEIIGRTPNGLWYFIRNVRNNEGWTSTTLLSVDPAIATRVPVLPIVSVFTTGNVYAQPQGEGAPVDQVFVGETVDLLGKTSDGEWYEVETVREVQGWVSASLLGIPLDVAADVPVDRTGPTTSTPEEEDEEPPPADAETSTPEADEPAAAEPSVPTGGGEPLAGLTAQVQNTGSLRDQPDPNAEVLGEISAGESVELLQKTANATWFRIRSTQGVEGWVNSSLLTVAPDVMERVPIA